MGLSFCRSSREAGKGKKQFAGRYVSDEVDGAITIRAEGGKLIIERPGGEAELVQIRTDGFTAPAADAAHLSFTRDASGRVNGLTLTTFSGVSRLEFSRLR